MEESTLTIVSEDVARMSTSRLAALFLVCFAGNLFAGVVSTLMGVYLPVVVSEFHGTQSAVQMHAISATINALFIFGWAAGGFAWGFIGDRTGRKSALLLAIGSYGLFTTLTAFTQGLGEVMICRFLCGFGAGGMLVISFTLITEVWPPKSRAVFTGILSIGIPIGIFSAGLINYLVSSWRQGFLVGLLPVVFAIAGFWMISESGLWQKAHADDDASARKSIRHLFSGENGEALFAGSIIFGTALIGLWAIFLWLPTWIQSLLTHDANKEGGIAMMFLGMGGLLGGFISGWLVNIIGLKKALLATFIVCAVFTFVLFKTNDTFSGVVYFEIAILALFFGANQGVLSLYIPLLFPADIRASATGLCFNIGRIATGFAVLFVGFLVSALGGYGNALFIFSLVFVIGLVAVLLFKNIQPTDN